MWGSLGMFACALAAPGALAAADAPNILLVVIDDLGWDDVGFRAGDVATPTIDGLAARGIVLERMYGAAPRAVAP